MLGTGLENPSTLTRNDYARILKIVQVRFVCQLQRFSSVCGLYRPTKGEHFLWSMSKSTSVRAPIWLIVTISSVST